jgi:hypothetical protein
MEWVGYPLDRSAIAKIESRKREVSAEELVVLAFVLNVPPSALLFPQADTDLANDVVQLAPSVTTYTGNAHAWARGLLPMGTPSRTPRTPRTALSEDRFYSEAALTDVEADAEKRLPGVTRLRQFAVGAAIWAGRSPEREWENGVIPLLEDLGREIKSVREKAKRSVARARMEGR